MASWRWWCVSFGFAPSHSPGFDALAALCGAAAQKRKEKAQRFGRRARQMEDGEEQRPSAQSRKRDAGRVQPHESYASAEPASTADQAEGDAPLRKRR